MAASNMTPSYEEFEANQLKRRPYSLTEMLTDFTIPIYGYISPIIVLFTLLTNLLLCCTLLKANMRTPTNLLLSSMAIADTLTGSTPIPAFLYYYTFDNYKEPMSCRAVVIYKYTADMIPTICHTASIWLTVALAVQRYVTVCLGLRGKKWFTIRSTLKLILIITLASVLVHLTTFFEYKNVPVRLNNTTNSTDSCAYYFRYWVWSAIQVYFNVYFWFRVVAIHVVPCILLVILNTLLVQTMQNARKKRRQLLQQNRKSECRKIKESNCTTLLLVLVCSVFLMVEFPAGTVFTLHIISNTFYSEKRPLMSNAAFNNVFIIFNLFILLSYPVNFFLYCSMSKQFRETFKRMFIPGAPPLAREHSQYHSLATENGGTGKTLTTTETAI